MTNAFAKSLAAPIVIALLASASASSAQGADARYAVEVNAQLAYAEPLNPLALKGAVLSSRRGGLAYGGAAVVRSPYFVAPFVDVGYVPLASSQQVVDVGSAGGRVRVTGALDAIGFVAGAAVDLGLLRLRAGVGLYDLRVNARVENGTADTLSTSERDLGYLFAVTAFVVRVPTGRRTYKLGLEGRLGLVTEAGINYASIGLVVTEDAFAW